MLEPYTHLTWLGKSSLFKWISRLVICSASEGCKRRKRSIRAIKVRVHFCFLNPEILNQHHYSVLHDFVIFRYNRIMGTESFVFENFGGTASLSPGTMEDEAGWHHWIRKHSLRFLLQGSHCNHYLIAMRSWPKGMKESLWIPRGLATGRGFLSCAISFT